MESLVGSALPAIGLFVCISYAWTNLFRPAVGKASALFGYESGGSASGNRARSGGLTGAATSVFGSVCQNILRRGVQIGIGSSATNVFVRSVDSEREEGLDGKSPTSTDARKPERSSDPVEGVAQIFSEDEVLERDEETKVVIDELRSSGIHGKALTLVMAVVVVRIVLWLVRRGLVEKETVESSLRKFLRLAEVGLDLGLVGAYIFDYKLYQFRTFQHVACVIKRIMFRNDKFVGDVEVPEGSRLAGEQTGLGYVIPLLDKVKKYRWHILGMVLLILACAAFSARVLDISFWDDQKKRGKGDSKFPTEVVAQTQPTVVVAPTPVSTSTEVLWSKPKGDAKFPAVAVTGIAEETIHVDNIEQRLGTLEKMVLATKTDSVDVTEIHSNGDVEFYSLTGVSGGFHQMDSPREKAPRKVRGARLASGKNDDPKGKTITVPEQSEKLINLPAMDINSSAGMNLYDDTGSSCARAGFVQFEGQSVFVTIKHATEGLFWDTGKKVPVEVAKTLPGDQKDCIAILKDPPGIQKPKPAKVVKLERSSPAAIFNGSFVSQGTVHPSEGLLLHTCHTAPGYSGSLIFAAQNGKWGCVGVHAGAEASRNVAYPFF